jgi:hypothetical protein
VTFSDKKNEYRKWCSPRCQASDASCLKMSRQTRLEKYGSPTYHGVDKAMATRQAKNYGAWHLDGFGDKVRRGKVRNGH